MTPSKLIKELIFALECQELTEVIRDGRPFSGRGRGGAPVRGRRSHLLRSSLHLYCF